MTTRVNILGAAYTVKIVDKKSDKRLSDCDGYTDKTSHLIVVDNCKNDDCNLDNPKEYILKCLCHEVIHAYMFESGLHENWEHKRFGQEETTVDWFAVQYFKIRKTMDALEKDMEKEGAL